MAAIVAADVTSKNQWYMTADSKQGVLQPTVLVLCKITVDPGTDDTYPSGGIPLTALFTAADASDTKLDFNLPIKQIGSAQIQAAAATFSPSFSAKFEQGSTAAANVLRIRRPTGKLAPSAATITGTTLAVASGNITDSGNGLVTAGFVAGDIVSITGFTGATTNNTWAVVTTVAAGTLTLANPAVPFTNDAAGESVTVTALRATAGFEELPLIDVTGATIFNGDTDPYVEIMLLGQLRAGAEI